MRILGIDPSLSSTAVCAMSDDAAEFYCFTKGKSTKWTKAAEPFARMVLVDYDGHGQYSDSEVQKLVDYQRNANQIVDTLGLGSGDQVLIEGYAFRAPGNIVDLVMFGTFLRKRILDAGAQLTIVAPMSLKYELAKLAYGVDKKGVPRNPAGLAGGKFTKHEMLEALFALDLPYVKDSGFRSAMSVYYDDMMKMASIPSPINDCVDAKSLCVLRREGKL